MLNPNCHAKKLSFKWVICQLAGPDSIETRRQFTKDLDDIFEKCQRCNGPEEQRPHW